MDTQLVPAYVAPTIELDGSKKLASPISWYTVALIVLLAFAVDIAAAVLIWCVAHGQSEVITWSLGANNTVRIACQ